MQLEREKSKAGGQAAVSRLTLHVWPRKTKQKPFGAPAAPAGVDEQMGQRAGKLNNARRSSRHGDRGRPKAEFREEEEGGERERVDRRPRKTKCY